MIDEFKQLKNTIINNYIQKENQGNILPLKNIIFTSEILKEIENLDADFNKNSNMDFSGYTVLHPDNTATIIIEDVDMMKNLLWVETLVHELTHVKDYNDYLHILNYENMQEMRKSRPFYYWTEFHARYTGYVYLLSYVIKFPEKYKQQYIYDTEKRLYEFTSIKNSQCSVDDKIYYTMHLIGEILAYEKLSIYFDKELYLNVIKKFDWFEETKSFLESRIMSITKSEMLLLSMNMNRVFSEQEV